MSILTRPGAQLFYDVIGSPSDRAPIVTLVNGHTRSSGDFRGLTRYLDSLGICSIIIDNRGSGRSEVTRDFSLEEMEDDVVAVWDEVGVVQSSLLGISMGGFICQGISLRYPDRVSKLILVSTANDAKWIKPSGGGWVGEQDAIEEKLATYFAPGFVARNQLLFDTMVKQTKAAIEGGAFVKRSQMQKEAVYGVSGDRDLAKIKTKTLVIHGDQDQVIDVKASEELTSKIPNSQKKTYPGIGHLILAESPKTLYEDVVLFLKS